MIDDVLTHAEDARAAARAITPNQVPEELRPRLRALLDSLDAAIRAAWDLKRAPLTRVQE